MKEIHHYANPRYQEHLTVVLIGAGGNVGVQCYSDFPGENVYSDIRSSAVKNGYRRYSERVDFYSASIKLADCLH